MRRRERVQRSIGLQERQQRVQGPELLQGPGLPGNEQEGVHGGERKDEERQQVTGPRCAPARCRPADRPVQRPHCRPLHRLFCPQGFGAGTPSKKSTTPVSSEYSAPTTSSPSW